MAFQVLGFVTYFLLVSILKQFVNKGERLFF